MIIKGKNLRLYYWNYPKNGGMPGTANIKEIEEEEVGYMLEPGQMVSAIRYEGTNIEAYHYAEIKEVNTEGITINGMLLKKDEIIFLPWKKEFERKRWENGVFSGIEKIMCDLYIEPCDILFEKNKMKDIFSRNIPKHNLKTNGEVDENGGEGIWYRHGGSRINSIFERNLFKFIKMGQQELI